MRTKIINYFFDSKEEYEAFKPTLKVMKILLVINIIAIVL